MTEPTVPRVAKFADLRVGMTVETVRTHSSGTSATLVGVVSEVTAYVASDSVGFRLATPTDDNLPHVTLRILADPTPKLPTAPGTVILIGDNVWKLDAFGNWHESLTDDVLPDHPSNATEWVVIHDPNAPKADPMDENDPLDENDHRDRIDRYGLRITRCRGMHWHLAASVCCDHCRDNSLADWDAASGPLRFADEVTA